MARCLAAAISHAPGLSGIPDCGHCSSAATSASCASSSATPMSRTIRVSPAMIRPDSIRQTASIARCVGVVVTATHHTILRSFAQAIAGAVESNFVRRWKKSLRLASGREVFRPEHLANLSLALPTRPVFLVQLHKTHRALDRLLFRFQFKLRVAADNLLGLRERPVDHRYLPAGKPHAGSQRGRAKSAAPDHSVPGLFRELVYLVHQRLRRTSRFLARLDDHHEFHLHLLYFYGCEPRLSGLGLGHTALLIRRTKLCEIDRIA